MMNTIRTIARKESVQMLRSQRGLWWLLAFSGLLSAFSLLLVSNTELSLLDNAQVVYMMAGTVLAAGALLAAILGSDAYAGEKERGTLVPLLCAPIAPNALLAGKAMGLLAAWGVMFAVATPYLWAVGANGKRPGIAAQHGHTADAGRKSADNRSRSARHSHQPRPGRRQPFCRSAQHLRQCHYR
jgi:ABC-type transport system involved in multi-copper enzyme maturation permease subunit